VPRDVNKQNECNDHRNLSLSWLVRDPSNRSKRRAIIDRSLLSWNPGHHHARSWGQNEADALSVHKSTLDWSCAIPGNWLVDWRGVKALSRDALSFRRANLLYPTRQQLAIVFGQYLPLGGIVDGGSWQIGQGANAAALAARFG